MIETAYRFEAFELYPTERLLKRDGVPVPLQPKVFDALLYLVRRAQHLVSKEELVKTLWPNVHVSEANLTNTIVTLRKLLGRDAVRTISKHGYRFELPISGEPGVSRPVYEKFSRARDLIEQRSLESMQVARDLLWICLAEDPSFARTWAWLGRCCWFIDKFSSEVSGSSELANAALQRAFALDSDLADAHQFYTFLQVDTGHADEAIVRLLERLDHRPREPETFAGLVQALRYQGLLHESVEAHRCAVDLDPGFSTSVAHTLFLAGDFASAIEAYTGRAAYYLDAAAWAALGLRERSIALLHRRLREMSLSTLMTALLSSLLATLEGRAEEALRCMESAASTREPEVLIYFARHYSFLGLIHPAMAALKHATEMGFICAPETLQSDPWFERLREQSQFDALVRDSQTRVEQSKSRFEKALDHVTAPSHLNRT